MDNVHNSNQAWSTALTRASPPSPPIYYEGLPACFRASYLLLSASFQYP